jgi:hypothetical protein
VWVALMCHLLATSTSASANRVPRLANKALQQASLSVAAPRLPLALAAERRYVGRAKTRKVDHMTTQASVHEAPILHCPCCGADFFARSDGSGACGITGLGLPASLVQGLREAYPVFRESENVLNDAYFEARWYCPSCRSPLAADDSTCPRCERGLREFAAELVAANPTRCSREHQ